MHQSKAQKKKIYSQNTCLYDAIEGPTQGKPIILMKVGAFVMFGHGCHTLITQSDYIEGKKS